MTNIVSVYLKAEMKTDKYVYTSFQKGDQKELMVTQRQRYERLLIISMILSYVEMIFKTKMNELGKTVEIALKDKNFKELSTTAMHQAFAHAVKTALHDEMETGEPIEIVKHYFEEHDFYKEFK